MKVESDLVAKTHLPEPIFPLNHDCGRMSSIYSSNCHGNVAWRIIPVSKWLGSAHLKAMEIGHFEGKRCPILGDCLTKVINDFTSTGMILRVS